MLDLSFYSKSGKPPITIDVSEHIYEWLLHTDFVEIGVSRPHTITLDDEEVELNVVELDTGRITNRQRLRDFLVEVIVQEADEMVQNLGDAPSPEEYREATTKLRVLQQFRRCLDDRSYQLLQRA